MNSPTEPSADMRAMAHTFREMFVALRAEGFNEQQALAVIGQTIAASIAANQKPED